MNTKLLRKIQAHILEEPRRFFMSSFIHTFEAGKKARLDGVLRETPDCKTAACIGGWAVLLNQEEYPVKKFVTKFIAQGGDFWRAARKALNISDWKADHLFDLYVWPNPFRDGYLRARSVKTKAKIAAKRIDHFIRTKGRE